MALWNSKSNQYACSGATMLHKHCQTSTTSCNIQRWTFSNLIQQHSTCCNILQQGGQTFATCCAQQCCAACCAMLRWNVACVWPGLNGKFPLVELYYDATCQKMSIAPHQRYSTPCQFNSKQALRGICIFYDNWSFGGFKAGLIVVECVLFRENLALNVPFPRNLMAENDQLA